MLILMGWPQLLCKPSMTPPCRLGIQKLHIHWKCLLDLEFIQTRSATCRALSTDREATGRPRRCCLPWRHRRVTWITRPPLWRSFHYRILKSLLPQNNTFFIATASVVKDAVDSPDCQGFREQWYYLRFYVRRTMPPTAFQWGSPDTEMIHQSTVSSGLSFINSLAPGRFQRNFRKVIFKLISVIGGWSISCKIVLKWMPMDLTDGKSTLVQVMAWCRQATSHYQSQCWQRSLSPSGITRPQRV